MLSNTRNVRKYRGYGLVLTAAILWGTTGTAQAFAPASAAPSVVGAARLAVGACGLLILAAMRGVITWPTRWPKGAIALAAVSIAAYQPFFFFGVSRTGVVLGTIVTIGSAPILAGLLEWVFRGERPGRLWYPATATALLGCILLLTGSGRIAPDLWGIISALAAGLSYAVNVVASKRLLANHPPDAVMAVVFGLGAIILLPVLLTQDLGWITQSNGTLVALHLGLIATTAAYALFSRGLKLIPTASAVTLGLAEPLMAGMLGVLVLAERFTQTSASGAVLLFIGLTLTVLEARRPIQ